MDDHLAEPQAKNVDANLLSNCKLKTKPTKEFESRRGLSFFSIGQKTDDTEARMGNGFFTWVKQTLQMTRAEPKDHHETEQLFVSIVNAQTCKDIMVVKNF